MTALKEKGMALLHGTKIPSDVHTQHISDKVATQDMNIASKHPEGNNTQSLSLEFDTHISESCMVDQFMSSSATSGKSNRKKGKWSVSIMSIVALTITLVCCKWRGMVFVIPAIVLRTLVKKLCACMCQCHIKYTIPCACVYI